MDERYEFGHPVEKPTKERSMANVLTGTLDGPHGSRVGRYVPFEDHHNETQKLRSTLDEVRKVLNQCLSHRVAVEAIDLIVNHDGRLTHSASTATEGK